MKKRWLATMLGLALFWQQCGSLALASEVTEPVVIQQEADVTAEENEAQQEKNQEAGFSEEDSEEEEALGEKTADESQEPEGKVPESQEKSVEDGKMPETENRLEGEETQNIPAESISSALEAQKKMWNYIELDESFDGSSFMYGETVTIPYTVYSYGDGDQLCGVTIYNSRREFAGDWGTLCPETETEEQNYFECTAKFAPGIYYVQPYIYADEMQITVDKESVFYITDDPSMHFVRTTDEAQAGRLNNLSAPLSAWKKTPGSLPFWYNDRNQSYMIRLEEMYVGDLAAAIIEDENYYNEKPKANQQWLLMKFWLKNTGSGRLDAWDVLGANDFYTRTGASATVWEVAAFAGDRADQGLYDVSLYGGAEGYFWVGVLISKSTGYPYIALTNDYTDDGDLVATWMDTDPYAQDTSANWPFSDIPIAIGSWRYEAIRMVYKNGIMNGISGTTLFAPDDNLTRAMFATIIYRMEGSPAMAYTGQFPDVPGGNYFSAPISWTAARGIMVGHSNTGLFGTHENITREDLVTVMYRYAATKGYNRSRKTSLDKFADASQVSGYAREAMQWAVANGIINGRSNTGLLDPKGNATRVEAAAIIQRFLKYAGR